MDFAVNKRFSRKHEYKSSSIDLAYRFAKEAHKELKDMVKSIIIFGSTARKKQDAHDIDILLLLDDVSIFLTPEITQAYRVIVEQTVRKVSPKIHVTSMKLTSFWEYVRAGDPIALNVLRDGYPLLDTGFFEPLQALLHQGRIRPSSEALWAYYNRAPRSLKNSRGKLFEACIDLYWAVIDSAHAALMSINEIPPSPEHVAEMIDEKLVKKGLIAKKYSTTARKFFALSKDIVRGKIKHVSGVDFEKYYKEASEFVERMQKLING